MANSPSPRKEKSRSAAFAKGGNGHMFGPQGANAQKPGETAHNAAPGAGAEFAKGGQGKMFGFTGSQPAKPGCTSAR